MGTIISLAQAQGLVAERAIRPPPTEIESLASSLGRRLGRDFFADGPWPSTDRSAMDGFAVAAGEAGLAAGVELPVVGESLAGHPFEGEVAAGQAIRIMTGAVVPDSVDAVVPVENTSGFGAESVTINATARRGDHIRLRGSEVAEGELLLAAGTVIRSAEVGALAVLGLEQVPVYRRPRVAILSTGDEVVPIGSRPEAHQVRDSNSHALAAQVRECGGEPLLLGVGRDRRDELLVLLERGLEEADVLLTIGGVSKGTHDLVHGLLAELAVDEVFHGIALKPGKPTFFGEQAHRRCFVFGLPGNPASCYTVFDLLVRPLLARLAGALPAVAETGKVGVAGVGFRSNWRLQAVPARLRLAEDGLLSAELTELRPSGNPFALLGADGFALVPEKADPEQLRVVPFSAYGGGRPAP